MEETTLRYFSEAYRKGKLSHAYILEGADPKETNEFAGRLAGALLCSRAGEGIRQGQGLLKPCGTCPSCIKAKSGNHPDIIRVTHEKDTVLSVNEIRQQVVADIAVKPYYGPYKIYLIPDAGLMNDSAQNALLKTMEEPQEYGLILLITDNADGFLPTIRSRCIRIRLADPSREEFVRRLLDGDVERALQIIRRAGAMTAVEITGASKELEAMDPSGILRVFQLWIRDLLVAKSTGDERRLFYKAHAQEIRDIAGRVSWEALNRMLLSREALEDRMRAKGKTDAACETFLLQIRRAAEGR